MKRLFGGILLGVGILIALVSGLCTLWGIGTALTATHEAAAYSSIFIFAGLIQLTLGIGLIIGGRALWKSGTPPKDDGR